MDTISNAIIKTKNANGGYDYVFPITKLANVKDESDKSLDIIVNEIVSTLNGKLDSSKLNQPNGPVALDQGGLIPKAFIPTEFKEIKIVDNIEGRDAILAEELFSGLSVYVKDATTDETVEKGGAYYIYDGEQWVKTAEAESLDVSVSFNDLSDKPTTIAGYGITDAVNTLDVVDTAQAHKILKLDADAKLPASITGNAETATKLKTPVFINATGDIIDQNIQFDGSENINVNFILKNSEVTPGTYIKVTVNEKGIITGGSQLSVTDIPDLPFSKIIEKPTTLEGYGITDAISKHGGTLEGHLTLHADPTESMHAATKQYVDNMAQGLDAKESVKVATTGNITLLGPQIIDGVSVVEGDRVLVKDQANKVENGIYVVSNDAWTRSLDANSSKNMTSGMFTFVEEGSTQANIGFVLVTDGEISPGTTEIEFTRFSKAEEIIAGTGLTKSGTTISLSDTGVGPGTYTKVTVDAQGRVTSAENLTSSDLPEIPWENIINKPSSSVEEIDDTVNKKHEHSNIDILEKIVDGGDDTLKVKQADGGQKTVAYVENLKPAAVVSSTEPDLNVGGIWFQIIE